MRLSPKRVLILASAFSPHSGPGSTRAAMFAKYLPEWGWEPHVVCGEFRPDNCDGMYDPAFCPEAQQRVVMRYNRDPVVMGHVVAQKGYELLNRMAIALRPDLSNLAIARRLRRTLPTAIRQFKPHVVFATAPPVVNHATAAVVCRQLGVPWVADFRDWLAQSEYRDQCRPWRYQWRTRRWVATARSANALITVSEGLRDSLSAAMGRHVDVIRNGFDPDSYTAPPPGLEPVFTITYTGSLFLPQRDPRLLFHALDQLAARGDVRLQDIRLNFVGANPELVRNLSNEFRCRESVRCQPWMARSECTRLQQTSHLLLLCSHAGDPGVMTGKLYEYLGACRPILSIPKDHDEVDRLLKETGAGIACSTTEEITRYLSRLYVEWQITKSVKEPKLTNFDPFNRRLQARSLSYILSNIHSNMQQTQEF